MNPQFQLLDEIIILKNAQSDNFVRGFSLVLHFLPPICRFHIFFGLKFCLDLWNNSLVKMYFANTDSSINLTIYKSLLDKYLEEKKDEDVRKLFEEIILTTHKLIIGEILEAQVNNKIYNLVTSLSDYEKKYTRDYFSKINPHQIGIDQFKTLSGILYSLIGAENSHA